MYIHRIVRDLQNAEKLVKKKKYTYFGGLGFNLGNESVLGWKPKNCKIYRDCGSRNGHFLRPLEVVCRTIA